MKALVSLVVFLTCSLTSLSQPSAQNFRVFSVEDDFPSAFVWSLLRDSRGYMWYGTHEGLIRYDGISYQTYLPAYEDSTQLIGETIFYLYEDLYGKIWMLQGTQDRLDKSRVHVFDPETERFSRMDFAVLNPFSQHQISAKNKILQDKDSTLWFTGYDDHLIRVSRNDRKYKVARFNITNSRGEKEMYKADYPGSADQYQYLDVLATDSRNRLWIGTTNGKLLTFDKAKEQFSEFAPLRAEQGPGIIAILEDKKGIIWIGYENGKIIGIDEGSVVKKIEPAGTHAQDTILYMTRDNSDNLWLLTRGANHVGVKVDRVNTHEGSRTTLFASHTKFLESLWTAQIQIDDQGVCYVYAHEKFYRFDAESQSFQPIWSKPENLPIFNFYVDYEKNIWFSSQGTGVVQFHESNKKFTILSHSDSDPLSIGDNNVLGVFEDSKGNIFVGHARGLDQITIDENHRILSKKTFFAGAACGAPLEDPKGNIWTTVNRPTWLGNMSGIRIGGIVDGHEVYMTPNKDFESFARGIYEIYPDHDHQLICVSYLSSPTESGIATLNTSTRGFSDYIPVTGGGVVFGRDQQDIPWLYHTNGLSTLNENREQLKYKSNGAIGYHNQIMIDSDNNLWLLADGLYLFDTLRSGPPKKYGTKEGLMAATVFFGLEDKRKRLWLTTSTGLTCFDRTDQTFVTYTTRDGLPTNFLRSDMARAGIARRNGEFMFASSKGLVIFHPDNLPHNKYLPRVEITDLKLFNVSVPIGGEILRKSISRTGTVVLQYDQNVFSLNYAGSSFANPAKNQYAYMMENVDPDWNYVGNTTTATYSGLQPGEYTFKVKASNNDGLWNENPTTLFVTILPPPWRTWWAYSLYGLVLVSGLSSFYRFRLKQKLNHAEQQKLRELDQFKSRFYTNITHEFRTPLTVILGMADQIQSNHRDVKVLIRRNANNLLNLVNQMLDLSKLEAGMLNMNTVQADIVSTIRYSVESFHSLAEQKGLTLHFLNEVDELVMDHDPERIMQVVANLVSNAIKFTPEGGHVYIFTGVQRNDKKLEFMLRVKDTGIGLTPVQQAHVFDRFYQADDSSSRKAEGTGIGLALVQELVKLMKGGISVHSISGQGAEFIVVLPVTREAPATNDTAFDPQMASTHGDPESGAIVNNGLPRAEIKSEKTMPVALVVEDNQDVVHYIKICLEEEYKIKVARNGQEGIDTALAILPDVIISDVMMPEKNGYELCAALKNDIRTSHIPIIMLTAKASEDDKLAGLDAGVDAYLVKPFAVKELRRRMKNLIAQRERLWKHYNDCLVVKPKDLKVSSQDEKFLARVLEILEQNKSDASFGSEAFTRELGISRTLLYVKLKALTGQSASEFIRTYRLKYAAQLILEDFGNITQIAYEAGFNEQSYFTKCFKAHFGVAPSEYAAKSKGHIGRE